MNLKNILNRKKRQTPEEIEASIYNWWQEKTDMETKAREAEIYGKRCFRLIKQFPCSCQTKYSAGNMAKMDFCFFIKPGTLFYDERSSFYLTFDKKTIFPNYAVEGNPEYFEEVKP